MTAGRVQINGETVTALGAKVDIGTDVVTLDGVEVLLSDESIVLILNKPAGVVTTMSDPQGRPTVADLVPSDTHPGLFPVGRLDAETTGLLLFTTDGELGHRLLHPRWKVPKTYLAEVEGWPDADALDRLRHGVTLDDGPTAPAELRTTERTETTAVIEITIREGRKRQVRRMFSKIKHPVITLERISFGPIRTGRLEEGTWRYLDEAEVRALRRVSGFEEE